MTTNSPESRNYVITAAARGKRIDRWLAEQMTDQSRTYVQQLIADGQVMVNDRPVKSNYKLVETDTITVTIPPPVPPESLAAEQIPLDILYEDDQVLVVSKGRGMVVHPAAGHHSGTLVNALLGHCGDLAGVGGVARPGIVHRLDKNTTGVMVVAKTDLAHHSLAEQIKSRSAKRTYHAIVRGNIIEEKGIIDAPLGRHPQHRQKMAVVREGGKEAVTHFTVKERFGQYTLVECRLQTGRTHQIRVHFAYIGFPVLGDLEYGVSDRGLPAIGGQCLHSISLEFTHPVSNDILFFTAPIPEDLQAILAQLRERKKGQGDSR